MPDQAAEQVGLRGNNLNLRGAGFEFGLGHWLS
jgi:hypothetical protein